jgi:hypothetical protein
MKKLAKYSNHGCCPKDWRQVSDLTGSYELDAVIQRAHNRDMVAKLEDHLVTDVAYQKRTAYNSSSLD